jgi:exodeoxyribonuclease-3
VLCLQETRVAALPAELVSAFERRGFVAVAAGRAGSNGVAIAACHPLSDVEASGSFGSEVLDREPRLIAAVVDGPIRVRAASVYVPHGRAIGHEHYEYKVAFLEALGERCRRWLDEGPLVLGGDVNVAMTDRDVFHPDAFVGKTHVSPRERDAFAAVLATGLVDLDVARWGPRARRFTWWNHGVGYPRNLGMRIDVLAASTDLAERLDTTWIDHRERGAERPSDHAALVADLRVDRPTPT